MAKRKASHPKKSSLRAKAGLSAKQYSTLKRNAKNARARLVEFSKRVDADNYFFPAPDDYILEALIERYIGGESLRSINAELSNLTAAKIRSGIPETVKTETGYVVKPSQSKQLRNAVTRANKNIRKARKEYSDFTDIMPQEFSYSDMVQNVTSSESIENKISDLALFTPENLVPTSINESGEGGTFAEYQYYRNILERENVRRERLRAQNDPRTQKGYFRQQSDIETSNINIDAIPDMEKLKKRAITWDDPARIYRANLYLSNYEKSLAVFVGALVNHGYWNDVIEERVEFIRDTIAKVYNNEDLITYIATRMPQLSISLISPRKDDNAYGGEVDFDAIYNEWADIASEFLSDLE